MASDNCLRCGTCDNFQNSTHQKFTKPCEMLGVRDFNPAPEDCYAPAPIKIVRADVNVGDLGKQLRHLDPDQMQVLGQLLTQSASLQQHGYRFGQPVYVNLGDGEFLGNYFKGFVVGCAEVVTDKVVTPQIYVSSDLSFEQADAPEFRTLLRLMPSSLLGRTKFLTLKERLITKDRLLAPDKDGYRVPLAQWIKMKDKPTIPQAELDDYDPPTLDTAPSAWLDPFSVNELESFKRAERDDRKGSRRDAIHDPLAADKRKQRAARRLQTVETVDEDGNVVRTTMSATEDVVINFELPEVLR